MKITCATSHVYKSYRGHDSRVKCQHTIWPLDPLRVACALQTAVVNINTSTLLGFASARPMYN